MDVIGDYEYNTKDLIGQGAFAVVYKGRFRKNPSRPVAVKSILKKNAQKAQVLLAKELKILKELTELQHENVVALLDYKDTESHFYLVMEYCNGGDLADYLNAKGTLSEYTIRLFLVQLAKAMRALNAKGIVHRDLKPQNILLSHNTAKPNPQPSEIKLKIADFGFARFLQEGVMAATLCGSPMYMAPEVIMNIEYDAKADLYSVGTIVFQCLTGKAPFQAQTPQALKQFYEKNRNCSPSVPVGTSAELKDLLLGLLKRNAQERMNFETFFNHKFLQNPEPPQSQSPTQGADLPLPMYGTPPSISKLARRSSTPIKVVTPPVSQPESPRSTRTALSSSPEDDYVMVPTNVHIPSENSIDSSAEKEKPILKLPIRASPLPYGPVVSPTRPSFLPISEPIPVPTQRETFKKIYSHSLKKDRSNSPSEISTSIPRSLPITMQKRPERRNTEIDISSMSPPSVTFVIGTPPGTRRRSTSGSWGDTQAPPNTCTVSPTVPRNILSSSPLKRSGTSPPALSGPLARVPILSSPNISDNNNLGQTPIIPFCTRAITLPDISEMGNYHNFFNETSLRNNPLPISFLAPSLPEETLLGKEHNDTLAKINFVLALSNCMLDIAAKKAAPYDDIVDPPQQPVTESHRKAEQMIIYLRTMQLLSSALSLAVEELNSGRLRPSSTVKSVMCSLNENFRMTLNKCKQMWNPGLIKKIVMMNIKAEELMYNHAVKMCANGALLELSKDNEECFQNYQTAQILFHALHQQAQHEHDRSLLNKYRESVETRLHLLEQQGVIFTSDF